MNDRIYMIGCALTGLCAHPQTEAPDDVVGRTAVQVADAALKAAGEPSGDSGQLARELAHTNACYENMERRACYYKRMIDSLKAEVEVHHPEVCARYEAEIARLKRLLEPLTEDESMCLSVDFGPEPHSWISRDERIAQQKARRCE